MSRWITVLSLLLVMAIAGCGGGNGETAPAAAGGNNGQLGSGDGANGGDFFESAYLDQSYEGALSPMMQLALGTLALEDGDEAVSAEQAATLLPFWQGLQGGSIQNQAERTAVLKQIEATMTSEQMEAIAAMQLTWEGMNEFTQSQGIKMPQFGGNRGEDGPLADMTDEDRQAFREEMQSLTPEERQARFAEMGIEFGEGGPGGGGASGETRGARGAGRFNALLEPLVDLLAERSSS